jgi:asparaginyl-tRNA synthetase
MSHVYVEDIGKHDGQEVTVKGWLYNKTDKGKLRFLLIRDGSGIIQAVVFQKAVQPEVFAAVDTLTQESSLIATGKVRADQRAPGGYELDVSHVEVIQVAEAYPITPKEHGTAFLMENRHLWIRSTRQYAALRIRSEIIKGCRDFFDDRGFVLVDTPIITPAACEGTTTLFGLDYFGEKAYLTQSGQLYNEADCVAFGKVYCFGPTFRAEKSKTRRHLMEFWMIEPEVAYAELDDVMVLAEDLVSYLVQRVLDKRGEELKRLEREHSSPRKRPHAFPQDQLSARLSTSWRRKGSETLRGAPTWALLTKPSCLPNTIVRSWCIDTRRK